MTLVVRKVIDPFRIKRDKPKYEIECEAFKECVNDNTGRMEVFDLYTSGDTLSELIDNAKFSRQTMSGAQTWCAEACGDEVEVYVTQMFLELQMGERG